MAWPNNVNKGAGVYLGPSATATVEASSGALKLFVLVVPKIPKQGIAEGRHALPG